MCLFSFFLYFHVSYSYIVNLREKSSPGPAFELGSPALRACDCATQMNPWAKLSVAPPFRIDGNCAGTEVRVDHLRENIWLGPAVRLGGAV